MNIALPSPEERQVILAREAARYPEPFVATVVGDGGVDEKLTLLLGNPSKNSEAWETACAATFKPRTVTADNEALVSDCLIWPDLTAWGGIVRRWPALPETIGTVLRRKLGGALSMIVEPLPRAGIPLEVPALIKEAQARNAAATWRQLKPDGVELPIDVAIQPPVYATWRLFQDSISAPAAECWPLAFGMAKAALAASSMPADAMFDRWPGLAMLVALVASRLAGHHADVEKGEF